MSNSKESKQPYIDQPVEGVTPINVDNAQGAVTEEIRKRFLLGSKNGNLCIRGDASKGLWAGNVRFEDAPWSVSLAGLTKGGGVAGADKYIQFNDNGVLGGASGMLWDKTNTNLQVTGEYNSVEYDNGNIAGTATINWNLGNVQYATMTGDTTLTLSNPQAGGRYILHLAGAFTPTFPATVRWTGGVTPAVTKTAGHKDIYTLIYSGKEGLYDVLQSPNYAIT